MFAVGVDTSTAGFVSNFIGTLRAMGRNSNGQLGDGTTITRITPVQISTDVSQVAAGGGVSDGHSLFVKTDDTLCHGL